MAEETIELPLDVIKASPGFSFDIGGSVAKLVYRSKEDFENGEPKNKQLALARKGIVRKKLITSEKVDYLLDFIKENCDLTLGEDGKSVIYTTGFGSNLQSAKIEETLNAKIKNLYEVNCFVDAMAFFMKTRPGKGPFRPVNEKGIKTAMVAVDTFRSLDKAKDPSSNMEIFVKEKVDDYDPEKDKQRLPCMLIICGSAFSIVMVNEDGSSRYIEIMMVGGRFFLGGVGFLTGITDFAEMCRLIEESDGKTADIFASDIADPNVKDDLYAGFNDSEWRVFPFARGSSAERDQVKQGDLIHSLLETVCDNLGSMAFRAALQYNAPRVYFCGNFINIPKAQEFITRTMHSRCYLEEGHVNFEFLQDGGVLGALGAFIAAHELRTKGQKAE